MYPPCQKLSLAPLSGLLLIVVSLLSGCQAVISFSQPTKTKTTAPKRPPTTKKLTAGNGRIELTALAALPNGETKPVGAREFWLLTTDPQELKSQIEKEFPWVEEPPSASKSLSGTSTAHSDLQQVAEQFRVSPEFAALAQKAPQDTAVYHDEPGYRRLEDYARVDELRKFYENLMKKKVKKGNPLLLQSEQKLEMTRLLEEDFQRTPPSDKTAIAVRLAQIVIERENRAFEIRSRQIERKNAVLQQRITRLADRIQEMEKLRKALRTTSTPLGVSRFSRLLPGTYWAFADHFEFEGINANWDIPIPLKGNEFKRIELMIGNR